MSEPSNAVAAIVPEPEGAGVTLFTVAALMLGLQFAGIAPASAANGFLPAELLIGLAMMIVGIIGTINGSHVIGLFFSTFGPFLISFALLSLGAAHGWWKLAPAETLKVYGCFLLTWTIILTLWLLLSVVLPKFFAVLLLVLNIALWLLVVNFFTSPDGAPNALQHIAGWLLILAAVGGLYFVASYWLRWAGIDKLPLGSPLVTAAE
ncbi:hypothetical protein HUN08_07480 [Gordonia sp. X0973]|uniref:GPR1/FUN34/YaaH family transporter n=1 Tax=Gordonia sp. X0973 TaxID=2742602 RepID=UPI0015820862|nr:GPR1/FUN34/YaaH family transporter [Gordonia sp. X0973]QKT07054.1 hypothetical protein HUN08_07480 [Gordonia sp. X0973]